MSMTEGTVIILQWNEGNPVSTSVVACLRYEYFVTIIGTEFNNIEKERIIIKELWHDCDFIQYYYIC